MRLIRARDAIQMMCVIEGENLKQKQKTIIFDLNLLRE